LLHPDEEVEAADNMDIIGKPIIPMKIRIICIAPAYSFIVKIFKKKIYFSHMNFKSYNVLNDS